MRNTAMLCLLLCACASAAPKLLIIGNSIPASRAPTLKDNMKATVSVFYTFRNPNTGEMLHSQVLGVVIDAKHVLAVTLNESYAAWYMHWKKARLEYASVTPYTPDIGDHLIKGPAPANGLFAKIVAEGAYICILEVPQSLPMPPVTFAIKKPRAGEFAYALGYKIYNPAASADGETFLRVWYSTAAKPLMIESWQAAYANDFALPLSEDKYPTQCGVFNQQHEFIGFFTSGAISIVSGNSQSEIGFRVLSLKSLAPLLREAGIPYNSAD